jgi:hypothetical protein
MDYAIANQRDRRNLTDAELAGLVMVVDKRKQAGRPPKELVSSETNFGKSSEVTAALTGTSPAKVSKIRAIVDYAEKTGDTTEKDAVLRGDVRINAAEKMGLVAPGRLAGQPGCRSGGQSLALRRV